MPKNILEIRNVSKIYQSKWGTTKALNGLSLDIHEGEVISLLGVNGAGKTTLSSILATLHPATSGDILYNGVSIYKDIVGYRKNLGFCPQKPNLDSDLNVEENLIFSGRYMLMSEQDIKDRSDLLIKQLQLEQYRKFNVNALSGGNKQRVLIARALMHSPKVIILDEPTVGLDPDIRRQLWQIIKDLRKYGVTVILTTHYLDEAEVLSDRICLVNRGRVVLIDTVSNLKQAHGDTSLEEVFIKITQEQDEQ